MKITEIIVSAGRTFNDPYEQFSNFRPSVTIKATVSEEENRIEVAKTLQDMADLLVSEHRNRILHYAKLGHEEAQRKWEEDIAQPQKMNFHFNSSG